MLMAINNGDIWNIKAECGQWAGPLEPPIYTRLADVTTIEGPGTEDIPLK
jgi:hypothetical protein